MRVDCGLLRSVKVARAGLPDGLAQPGNSPSICAGVRSASMLKRPSRSDPVVTRPASRTGIEPLIAFARIEAETLPRRLVEHALQADFRLGLAARSCGIRD